MRRTLASPNFATSSNSPPAICGEVLSASISTAKRGRRCCSALIGTPSVVPAVDVYWRSLDDSPKKRVEKAAKTVSAFRDCKTIIFQPVMGQAGTGDRATDRATLHVR